ncbi:RNA polymerase sigma-70 factor, ECF subfamily [Parapedobacter luteus]|uniref:RNA polymerase sigma-70 factor, ECF subfamily n=1 Tax=Parapedobacter luteus TaxID=623280 RepID=A0A1T5C530_9SPHI|nr:RNA polymerase sigma-70 factor [Parapedobacter luteus]SKB54453.1 RNA polymerase sigma-70 factor, ECF subfamily [Parapedobacter luteus]
MDTNDNASTIYESKEQLLSQQSLFEAYYTRLCDFARRFLGDVDIVEDVVQDVFVAYIERHTSVSNRPESIKAFLYQSVKNACLNRLRHEKVTERYEATRPSEVFEEHHALSSMIHAEVVGEIHQALRQLPEGCRMVIRLGFFEGLNNPQIAHELNISINTVKSQKQRALSLLRTYLSPQAMSLLLPILLF